MKSEDIEFWEYEYLKKIEYLLKLDSQKMFEGFQTKEEIRGDWEKYIKDGSSEFATGAERIFYWLFNQFGQPNSSPIGSDLFFETYNAYVHIDIKTVTLDNIGDASGSIFIGENQTSFSGEIFKEDGQSNGFFEAHLPFFYSKKQNDEIHNKICLTYFIVIVYDETNLDIYNIFLTSVPNGFLRSQFEHLGYTDTEVLKAGKNIGKIRFKFGQCNKFKLIDGSHNRTIIIHEERKLCEKYKERAVIYHRNKKNHKCITQIKLNKFYENLKQ